MRKIVLIFVVLMLVLSFLVILNVEQVESNDNGRDPAEEPWYLGWLYGKKITIDHNKIDEDLTNFPVLVRNTILNTSHVQTDGDDFLFTMDNITKLNHEIEEYNDQTGDLIAWVNVTSISSTVDTVFYMYYGNSSCSNQQNPSGTWDSDYIHVWHLGDDLNDSAGSADGTNHGTDIVEGKIGKARDFERDESDYIVLGDMAQPADSSLITITWEAWINPESIGTWILSKYDSSGTDYGSYHIQLNANGFFKSCVLSDFNSHTISITDNPVASEGQWIYLTSTFNLGGINEIKPYINGVALPYTMLDRSANFMWNTPVTDDLGRTRLESSTEYADIIIDEVRWSKMIRSDAWIKTTYLTMNDLNLLIIGNEKSIYSIFPIADFSYIPSDPVDTDIIQFTDKSTDEDGSIVSWWWDFDDGYFSQIQNTTHQFMQNGSYNVTLNIIDSNGFENTTQKTIIVNEGIQTAIQLKIGWNLLGWYNNYNTTASSLAENITGCISVSKWNATMQTYETYIVGGPPTFDFNIIRGMGLFVDVTEESIWFGDG